MAIIQNKSDLKRFLKADFRRYGNTKIPLIVRWIIKDEMTKSMHYLWVLRHTEYAVNTKSPFRLLWILWYKRLSNLYRIYINLNCCDEGLRLVHLGGGIYLNANKIGKSFTATSGVVIGKKGDNQNRPIIGDNVSFGIGSIAYGRIEIEDGAIITPNSVVIKNVPKYSIMSGVPAQLINSKRNL